MAQARRLRLNAKVITLPAGQLYFYTTRPIMVRRKRLACAGGAGRSNLKAPFKEIELLYIAGTSGTLAPEIA